MSMQPVATSGDTIGDAAAPDWMTFEDAIECPLCEYNVRGLVEPRCPECGYAFTWPEVLDPNRRRHPYLFEHHSGRSTWSFLATLFGGLRPRRFWRTLHPVQPARPWRLGAYLVLVMVVLALPSGLGRLIGIPDTPGTPSPWGLVPAQTQRYLIGGRSTADLSLYVVQPLVRAELSGLVRNFTIFCTAWLALTSVLLLIFRASMRRAKLRFHHVARCVVYGFDVVVWWGLILAAALVVNAVPNMAHVSAEPIAWTILVSLPLVWIAMSYRLACAYELYLRFDRPWWTVFSVQLIVALVFLLALLMLPRNW
jgi:hypothetical protein